MRDKHKGSSNSRRPRHPCAVGVAHPSKVRRTAAVAPRASNNKSRTREVRHVRLDTVVMHLSRAVHLRLAPQ